jgi:methylenetetrahydrofolate--tRNA-(uracil-5-)-methyltransferase
MSAEVHVIGGGLAGCEAAWQVARAGLRAILYEMRPARQTPAHKTGALAELVCSNSLKSESVNTAPWLLKEELRRLSSLLIGEIAPRVRVPAGHALTVDRLLFAAEVTRAMESEPLIEIRREEVAFLDPDKIWIVASGPLTSDSLAAEIARLTGSARLFFYDSISPIVDADSIDMSIAFAASRYGKSLDGTDDYLNCPFDRAQYDGFLDALLAAEGVPSHIEDDQPKYFEACLPIEELARRGRDTLRFGPMKPVGLIDPRTGRRPYAVVQLRREDARAGSYNLVGFQNHMRFGEQERVLRMIPGLQNAEFLRFGQVHRNTYINAPALLNANLQLRTNPNIFFAGQISGVEGYVESIATGLVAGRNAAALLSNNRTTKAGGSYSDEVRRPPASVRPGALEKTNPNIPRETAIGSLCAYVSGANPANYQPANITFDLLPPLENSNPNRELRRAEICRRALDAIEASDLLLSAHV